MAHVQAPGVPPARAGDWHCPNPDCKNHTVNLVYGSKSVCPLCFENKPAQPVTPAQSATIQPIHAWSGPAVIPPRYLQQQPQLGNLLVKGGRIGDWHCPNSNCKNHSGNVV